MSCRVQSALPSPIYNYIEDPKLTTESCLAVFEEARKVHEKVKQDLADLQKRFIRIDDLLESMIGCVQITPALESQIEADIDIDKINKCVTGIALNLKNTSKIVSSIIAHD